MRSPTLNAPLDIFWFVNSAFRPGGLAMGAIASGGVRVINEYVVRGLVYLINLSMQLQRGNA
jgi:hypothetical protein